MYINVLIETKVSKNDMTFTYHVPYDLGHDLIGKRVLVPFNNRIIEGFVISYCNKPEKYEVKDIISVIDKEVVLNEELLKLGKFMSEKYLCSLIYAYQAMLPRALKANHKSNKNIGLDFIDETKLCINVKGLNITGFRVYDILYQDFDIQVELGDLYNILALVSIGTTKDDIDRLIDALEIISKKFKNENILGELHINQINPIVKMNPRNAYYGEKESIELEDSVNRICGENIMAYPPGIPIISPGEIITAEILDYIRKLKENNAYLTDMQDKELKKVLVIKEK